MPINDFQMRMINGAVKIIGNFISANVYGKEDEQEAESIERWYERDKEIIKKYGSQTIPSISKAKIITEKEKTETKAEKETIKKDLTEEKIEEGVACLGCTKDHLTEASALLEEAANFSTREKGMKNPEVTDRMHAALEQFLGMERWDLKSGKIENMSNEEKEAAQWAKNKSAELRHMLNNVETPEDLRRLSSESSKASKEIFSKYLELKGGMTDDDIKYKMCGHYEGDKRIRCEEGLDVVMGEG